MSRFQEIDHTQKQQRIFLRYIGYYLSIYLMLIYVSYAFKTLSVFVIGVVFLIWTANIYYYFRMPTQRRETLRTGRMFSGGYLMTLILLQFILRYFWNMNPDDLSGSLNPSVINASPTVSMGIVNMLSTAFLIASISAPVGYFVTLHQKARQYQVGDSEMMFKRFKKWEGK